MHRKSRLLPLAIMLTLAVVLMAACGGGASKGEFMFGVVLVGPYNDHGWSEAHYRAGKYAEKRSPAPR